MPQSNHLLVLPRIKSKGSLSPVIRRMERTGVTPDGIVLTHIKSLSRPNVNLKTGEVAPTHQQEIDLHTGQCRCQCEHFRYRLAKHNPTLSTPHLLCKHLERALMICERNGEVRLTWAGKNLVKVEVLGQTYTEPMLKEESTEEYDAEHAEYLDELEARQEREARAELSGWLHEGEAPYSA